MAHEIVQHSHCHVCGRVVRYGDAACSDKCKGELERTRKGRKRSMLLMYALLAAVMVFFVVLPLVTKGG